MLRLLAVIPLVVATKGPCNEYFGKGTDDNSTVLDPQRLFRAVGSWGSTAVGARVENPVTS